MTLRRVERAGFSETVIQVAASFGVSTYLGCITRYWLLMPSRRYFEWFLIAVVAMSCQALQPAAPVLPKPEHAVTDRAGILSAGEIERLTKDLDELDRAGLARAVIYIDSALPPAEVLERLTLRSVNSWGLGRSGVNDGLAIFVFVADRKIRIELGRGLEDAISDADARSIIDEQMSPAFRRGDYADGLMRAIREIRRLLHRRRHEA